MKNRALGAVFLLLLGTLPELALAQPQRAGTEFRINTYTTNDQFGPRVGIDGRGNFIVFWQSLTQDGALSGIFSQRYDAAGAPIGGEFRVNTYTTAQQYTPDVAFDRDGNFVVVWHSFNQDGSDYGIFGQRFDAAAVPLGSEFQVNTYTTGFQYFPRVASDPAGNFVVVWQSPDGDVNGIVARRYDAGGVALGAEFRVNTYTTNEQIRPAIAMDLQGNFVVAWESEGDHDGSNAGVFAQRYDAAGGPQGGEFQINTYTTDVQRRASIAMGAAGEFVIVWQSYTQDGDRSGIYGQRYDAAGLPLGVEFHVSTYTTDGQYRPIVARDALGNFVVVWHSYSQDGSDAGAFGQRFDAAGAPRGGEFQIHTYTTLNQRRPIVKVDPVGNFVVVWQSETQDGSGYGVYGQRYGGLLPAALAVDAGGNGVLEPGETATVAPSWKNVNGDPLTFTGAASNLTGPAGATYALADPGATYGTVPNGATGTCGSDCFQVSVSNPATRPAQHWDITVTETIGPPALGQMKVWTLHVGASFGDVPPANPFYRFIETLLHVGVTAGCGGTSYCPDGSTTREQMAVFLLRAREGGGFAPPACVTAPFPDVPCASPFAPWVAELVARGITAGCGGGLYCPTSPVTREQMAVFLLKTSLGIGFTPPPCTTAPFGDVPCASPFAPWIQELVGRGITAGCGGGLYCPTDPVTRGQMAVFLTKTFGLALYGP
jgi:hypothetical protein